MPASYRLIKRWFVCCHQLFTIGLLPHPHRSWWPQSGSHASRRFAHKHTLTMAVDASQPSRSLRSGFLQNNVRPVLDSHWNGIRHADMHTHTHTLDPKEKDEFTTVFFCLFFHCAEKAFYSSVGRTANKLCQAVNLVQVCKGLEWVAKFGLGWLNLKAFNMCHAVKMTSWTKVWM